VATKSRGPTKQVRAHWAYGIKGKAHGQKSAVRGYQHEHQSVYNGVVTKITLDAVYFKENVLDAEGRVTTREVVKRLGSASGEGR